MTDHAPTPAELCELHSADGVFNLHGALAMLPGEFDPVFERIVHHEFSHTSLLLSTGFYATYASEFIKTAECKYDPKIPGLIEALPTVFNVLGQHCEPSVQGDKEIVEALRKIITRYREIFRDSWSIKTAEMHPPGIQVQLSPQQYEDMFDRNIGMAVAKSALSAREDRGLAPIEVITNLEKLLYGRPSPWHVPLYDRDPVRHIWRLMGDHAWARQKVRWLRVRTLLAKAIIESSSERLLAHVHLLPIIVRMPFFAYSSPITVDVSWFYYPTVLHLPEIRLWAETVGGYPLRTGVLEQLSDLTACFSPMKIGELAAIPREYEDKQEAARLRNVIFRLSIQRFVAALPNFIEWFLEECLDVFPEVRLKIELLRRKERDIVQGYLTRVEQLTAAFYGRPPDPEVYIIEDTYKFYQSLDANGKAFIEIALP